MIICLTGSHSTGKTTLLEFFKHEKGYETVSSVTRKVLQKEQRKVEEGVSDESQRRVLEALKESAGEVWQEAVKHPEKIYILDRCVFDFLAYTKAFRDRGWCSDEFVKYAEQEVLNFIEDYDTVFYLPIEFKCVDDGVRSMDESLREDVDKYIRESILWSKVRAVELTGSVLQRVQKIKETVEKVIQSSLELIVDNSRGGILDSSWLENPLEPVDPFSRELSDLWRERQLNGQVLWIRYRTCGTWFSAGYLLLENRKDGSTIRGLYVHPEFRNRGLAHNLVEKAVEFRENKDLWVNVTKGAEKIYEDFGFRRLGERKDFPDQVLYYLGEKEDSEIPEETWDKLLVL